MATGSNHPDSARRIFRQRRGGPGRTPLEIATAVWASPVTEAVHAVWAPGALECADIRFIRRRDAAVATFAVRANLKHVITLLSGIVWAN